MKCKKFKSKYFVRIDKGEEVTAALKKFCVDNGVRLGSVTGIGATDRVTIGLLNTATKEYQSRELVGMYEITSITGNITTKDGEVYLHLHITLGDEKYQVFGGHLSECWISGTCELVIDVADGEVGREFDGHSGLNLWRFQDRKGRAL